MADVDKAVEYLNVIYTFMQLHFKKNEDVEDYMKKAADNSVRTITGGRFEFFIAGAKKSTKAFDSILKQIVKANQDKNYKAEEMKKEIMEYAKTMAVDLHEESGIMEEYKFENFSMIFTITHKDQQIPHIDVIHPTNQFSLYASPGNAGTIRMLPHQKLRTIQDLKKYVWQDVPDDLFKCIDNNKNAKWVIGCYGDLLHSSFYIYKPGKVDVGDVHLVPGSMIHAGPVTTGCRATIFYSASTVIGNEDKSYNPDVQYSAPLLMAEIAFYVVSQLEDEDSYLYLLFLIAEYTRRYGAYIKPSQRISEQLIEENYFKPFLVAMENKIFLRRSDKIAVSVCDQLDVKEAVAEFYLKYPLTSFKENDSE